VLSLQAAGDGWAGAQVAGARPTGALVAAGDGAGRGRGGCREEGGGGACVGRGGAGTDRSGSSWRRRIGGVAVHFEGAGTLELEEASASAAESRGARRL